MKKLMILIGVVATAAGLLAGPCGPGGGRGCGGGPRPCGPGFRPGHGPRPCGPGFRPGHGPGDCWGRGGRNFWPGFVGGVVGGFVGSAVTRPVVVEQPVVVQQPVVVAPVTQVQSVWVEGAYVDQVQPNGTVVRVWSPGHYEQRTVVLR